MICGNPALDHIIQHLHTECLILHLFAFKFFPFSHPLFIFCWFFLSLSCFLPFCFSISYFFANFLYPINSMSLSFSSYSVLPLSFSVPPRSPFTVPAQFPCSLWCWSPSSVCVCVSPCTWADLPKQWAPGRLVAAGCRCWREQQWYASHRRWPSFFRTSVSCHQLSRLGVWICLGQHERWEIK